jgi:phosphomannomutase
LQRQAAGDRFVFAYEDAIGFSPTPRVRDKDGIATAVEVLRLAQDAQQQGMNLYARLNALYQRYGLSITRQVSLQLDGEGATERMNAKLKALRQTPPTTLAGLKVRRVHDYLAAERRNIDGSQAEPIGLPATHLIQLDLDAESNGDSAARERTHSATYHISIRPSGTEPKLKIYLEYLGPPGGNRDDSRDGDPLAHTAAQERQLQALAEALM